MRGLNGGDTAGAACATNSCIPLSWIMSTSGLDTSYPTWYLLEVAYLRGMPFD